MKPFAFPQDRKYVAKEGRTFIPSSLGRVLSTFLAIYFEKYVDYNFTAALEVSPKQRNFCFVDRGFPSSAKHLG
jgi:hypothetical protein